MSLDMTPEAVASEAGGAVPSASEPTRETVNTDAAAAAPTPAKEAANEAPKPSIDDTLRAAYRNSKRHRDEAGRFASLSPPAEPNPTELAEALAAPQEPAGAEAAPPEATAPDPALPPIEAPRDFTADQKAQFAKLPREAQEIVANAEKARLAEYTRRAQEHSDTRKQFDDYRRSADPFFQALQPFQQYLGHVAQSIGTPVPQMLAGLVQTEARLRTGAPEAKRAVLAEIAATYGIPLDGAAPAGSQDHALMGTIAQLRQELGQVKGYLTQQQQAEHEKAQRAEQATARDMQRTIAEFAKDKPYFEEVRPYAAALLEKSLATSLDQAYEQAVRAHPAVFAKIHADQRAADEAKRQAEAKAKAEQARKAAATNVRSAPSQPTPKTMDDTMREAFRRAQSAAA